MISPRILLAAHNMRPKKQLGQNFLTEPTTAEMIVSRSGILPEDVVLEIGAGLGALTIPVARTVKKVYAVEKDRQILDILKTQLLVNKLSNVVLMGENILEIDIQALVENMRRKIVVMGNLPYNISFSCSRKNWPNALPLTPAVRNMDDLRLCCGTAAI